jgi:hypothetical protein
MVGLLGGLISSSQGLYLHRSTQHRKTGTNIYALSGIRTRDPVCERSRPAPQTARPLDRLQFISWVGILRVICLYVRHACRNRYPLRYFMRPDSVLELYTMCGPTLLYYYILSFNYMSNSYSCTAVLYLNQKKWKCVSMKFTCVCVCGKTAQRKIYMLSLSLELVKADCCFLLVWK